jgi:Tol biopolymer transport system component
MSLPESDSGDLALGAYSPDGQRMVASVTGQPRSFLFDPRRTAAEQTPEVLPVTMTDGSWILPVSWSPDGRRLAGTVRTPSGPSAGLAIYDIAARTTRLIAGMPVTGVTWLARDNRRVLVRSTDDLHLVDVDSGRTKKLAANAGGITRGIGAGLLVSPDGRTIYASVARQQADVWVVDLKLR